jgi:hypothetical protein
MLNEKDSSMLLSRLSHQADIQHDSEMQRIYQETEYGLMALLKPRVVKDGNKWCVLYGDNLQDGVCGYGDTPYKAMLEFNKAWDKS